MAGEVAAALTAQVDRTLRVCDLLEQQRDSLLGRDLAQIETVTRALEVEFEELAALLQAGAGVLEQAEPGAPEGVRELAREVRAAQARLAVLVALNQAIIGDRLAWVSAALGNIHPGMLAVGYRPGRPPAGPRGALSRSA